MLEIQSLICNLRPDPSEAWQHCCMPNHGPWQKRMDLNMITNPEKPVGQKTESELFINGKMKPNKGLEGIPKNRGFLKTLNPNVRHCN